ncbi:hypothetical protein [Escherichia coli]|uniref:hypothetical protein n=1 Tax=Escherichia coli TaxID=562 RepID=UPI0040692CC4
MTIANILMPRRQYKTRIKIYLINGDRLRSLPCTKNWTHAIYFRFVIADYFFLIKHPKFFIWMQILFVREL